MPDKAPPPPPPRSLRSFAEGTINLYTRPRVRNPDGSISTVRSLSFSDETGREILIPTVERHGRGILSDEDAIKQYYATGEHLGMFRTPEEATAYAAQLHEAFARGDYDVPLATSRRGGEGDQLAAVLKRFLRQGPFGGGPLAQLGRSRAAAQETK